MRQGSEGSVKIPGGATEAEAVRLRRLSHLETKTAQWDLGDLRNFPPHPEGSEIGEGFPQPTSQLCLCKLEG